MKKTLCVAAMAASLLALPLKARAHAYDPDDTDHPLRLLAYALHPIGLAADRLVMRPIHCLVSWNKTTNLIFGHDSHGHFCCGDDHNCAKVSMVCPSDQTNQPAAAAAGTALEKPVSNTEEQHPPVGGVTRLAEMMTIYFDFDKSDLRPDQLDRIEKNLKYLKEHPELKIMIEGHCDERGTTEYNLALGERRAKSVMNYYVKNGIAADRIMMVSKGEEQPADPGHTEEAWSKNRRAEFDKVN